LVGIDNIN